MDTAIFVLQNLLLRGEIKMPFINTKTNINITDKKREELKIKFGKVIEIIPGKSENWLMLGFEDNVKMYFKGDDSQPIAFVEVKIFGSSTTEAYESLTKEITKVLNDVLNILPENIYIKFEEVSNWGWNGSNF